MGESIFRSWIAYQKGLELAFTIFRISSDFPVEERYSLTDQIRRSSRSVCANLSESLARRSYPKHFSSKLADAAAENFETQVWLEFALNCNYLDQNQFPA